MRNVNIKRHDITLPINKLYTECVQINVFQIKILSKVSPQIFNIKRWGERERGRRERRGRERGGRRRRGERVCSESIALDYYIQSPTLFQNIYNFVHFCPNFQIFCLFFEKSHLNLPLVFRIEHDEIAELWQCSLAMGLGNRN